jgi:hypothetical protein
METCEGCRYTDRYTWNSPCNTCIDYSYWSPKEEAPEQASPDPISHPPHYARYTIEPVQFLQSLSKPLSGPAVPWHGLNVIKYLTRYQVKNGLEDLRKAKQYLDWLIEEEEGRE